MADEWPCPEKAKQRIQAIMDSANREIGGVIAGVKLALDIPDAAGLDLERGVFTIPPDPAAVAGNGHQPNRAERRRAAKAAKAELEGYGDEDP